ncbi:MAG: ABC transporter ATP-binding protein, partial [Chloroflexia bacterium]|nr:ABC transporter ATP-binding protein [Chloroflexia bacterium]
IVYVTHDQQEALVMSDRIAVMDAGKIEQIGTPTQLYEEPASRFVASFIGESNFLSGRLLERGDGDAVVEVPGVGPLRVPGQGQPATDAEVVVTVRPEKIVFADETMTADAQSNAVEATVESVVFVGDAYRYEVRLGGGQPLVLKRQHRAGVVQHARGDQVRLGWHVADGRLV